MTINYVAAILGSYEVCNLADLMPGDIFCHRNEMYLKLNNATESARICDGISFYFGNNPEVLRYGHAVFTTKKEGQ